MPTLNPGDYTGLPLSTPGSILMANADGVLQWHENRPVPSAGAQQAYTFGSPAVLWTQTLSGTGAARTRQQTSNPRYACVCQLETGTTTTGRGTLQATSQTSLLATSDVTQVYEALVMVPTLPVSGGDDFVVSVGVLNRGDNAVGDGFRFSLSSASANWQAQVLATSTSGHDTGIPCVAGIWYRMRMVCVGITCTFYLIKDDDYHANGRSYGASVATDSTKDFSAVAIFPLMSIIKTTGTTSRFLQYAFLNWTRTPQRSTPPPAEVASFASGLTPGDGLALPQALAGQRLLVDGQGRPVWGDYGVDTDNTPFFCLDNGIETGSMVSIAVGTSASVARTVITGYPPVNQFNCGTTSTGSAERGLLVSGESETCFVAGTLDGYAQNSLLVYETVFVVPSTGLSDGTNTYTMRAGFYDSTFNYGVWFEFDANADTHWRVAYQNGGAVTRTATTLVGVLNTGYWMRIVWQPGGDAVCTIGTIGSNINTQNVTVTPSFGTTQYFHAAQGMYKSAGTTVRAGWSPYQLVYQRFL